MRSQRFYTEDFRGVMSAEQKIHAQLFSGNRSPVRSFSGDESVDLFLCYPVNFRACATSHNTNYARLFWTKIKRLYRTAECFPQFTNEIAARHRRACFQTDWLTFFFQKWLRGFQSKRGDEVCVVANFRMNVQRKMRAVERDVFFKGELQLPAQRACHRLQARPEQTVMHDQKVDIFLCSLGENTR